MCNALGGVHSSWGIMLLALVASILVGETACSVARCTCRTTFTQLTAFAS